MRLSILSSFMMAGSCLAQGDLAGLLKSQPDLSTLLELVGLVDGLAETLSTASNITIIAPTNEAFAKVPRDTPEGQAVELRNDTIAISALLANHVFKGVYPSSVITDIPTFGQTLLNGSYVSAIQPFSNFTGGAYNALVKNGDKVAIISGEQTVSTVVQADIKLGEGITIHVVDEALSFGAPLELFAARAGYKAFNAALQAANLGFSFGETGADVIGQNISDFTILVPTDEAFLSIGSVLASADVPTLQSVLKYHFIPSNVIFSPDLGNVTVQSLQGEELTFTVLPDGSCFVNNAQIVFPNTILYNGVAHVIDAVLAPGPFDRSTLKPSAPAPERLAFEGASSVSALPFTVVSFGDDDMGYTTTPELLKTVAAIAVPTAGANVTVSGSVAPSRTGAPVETFTGAADAMLPSAGGALAAAVGIAAWML
ncbi:hypothetical protein HBI56_009040 [Parastagonospora nodorum]|uniref:FAS1 domain-containing protein n=2 Tax=Phaeosphaeria nodorum (strain SN15 / ATCC MYA-4574 / FGSC 10173) TaxID=321614 RepID=A0A7U2EQB9_PHANO|nr:hypothetical protein SNOG_00432 [Parastagonospora nodorum SN15]KAH3904317.1 hypothetical protein HBH56_236510 [Parastagonospora nodorum]EAT91927.1 hypothetical protein SNOG_00432 [Parastagonospora nodorum SN15]KAH3935093.1 hypothetical protein HBH54_046220 [Parastagonospora nodorum]KAH3950071.1 hypothetical protein HBH53_077740 [Parastagonospora nodorum]KAH3986890.1 hypothetical protein HBH51_010790 [Parastagonospora nodorum]